MLDKAHHLMQLSLRRLKSDVEVSLPPKHEPKISVPLFEFQIHFYRALLMKDVSLLQHTQDQAATITSSSSSGGGGGGGDAMVAKDVANGLADENSEESSEEAAAIADDAAAQMLRPPLPLPRRGPEPQRDRRGDCDQQQQDGSTRPAPAQAQEEGPPRPYLLAVHVHARHPDDHCRFRGYEHARLDGSTNRVQVSKGGRGHAFFMVPFFLFRLGPSFVWCVVRRIASHLNFAFLFFNSSSLE